MTAQAQAPTPPAEQKNVAEINFRKQEQMYQKVLQEKENRIAELEKLAKAQVNSGAQNHEDDDDDEPYVDKKKLNKKLNHLTQQVKQDTQSEMEKAIAKALAEERKKDWFKRNSDFNEVMQHAEKLHELDPELAETILEMPDPFERQKLAYKNIKALGLHKPKAAEPTIQQKIDSNKRSPYYQPTSIGAAPYSSQSDFSAGGQKQAYDKMQELKKRLRLS